MDINAHPEFAETYAGIKRAFGAEWAKRFVLTAPLMINDTKGPMYQAFLRGLTAHARGAHEAEARAWATCQGLLRDLAASLVTEAEALLATSS